MKNPGVYLVHLQENLSDIISFTEDGQDSFLHDKKTRYAVLRSLEVVGEATKRLPKNLTSQYPDVPWSELAKFRDLLIHGNDRIDTNQTWDFIANDVSNLLEQIRQVRSDWEKKHPKRPR